MTARLDKGFPCLRSSDNNVDARQTRFICQTAVQLGLTLLGPRCEQQLVAVVVVTADAHHYRRPILVSLPVYLVIIIAAGQLLLLLLRGGGWGWLCFLFSLRCKGACCRVVEREINLGPFERARERQSVGRKRKLSLATEFANDRQPLKYSLFLLR